MTVSNTTNRTSAVGTGAEQTIPFTFPINANSDITVTQRDQTTGDETPLAETTNYTVINNGESGGSINTVTPFPTSGDEIHIVRDTPNTQLLDLEQGGSFNAENIEDALDKNAKLTIENDDTVSRVMKFPTTDPSTSLGDLPNSVDRAGKILTFDDTTGKPTASSAVPTGSVTISAFAETYLDDADALTTVATLQSVSVINVMNPTYGVTGNGSTNDTAGFQAAIDAAEISGQAVFIPEGTYKLATAITLAEDAVLYGAGSHLVTLDCDTAGIIIQSKEVTVYGFKLQGPGYWLTDDAETSTVAASPSSDIGLLFGDGSTFHSYLSIDDIRIDGFQKGLAFDKVFAISIGKRLRITNCQYGIYNHGIDTSTPNGGFVIGEMYLEFNGFNYHAQWTRNITIGKVTSQFNRNHAGLWIKNSSVYNINQSHNEFLALPSDLSGVGHPTRGGSASAIYDSDSSTGIRQFIWLHTVEDSNIDTLNLSLYRLGVYMLFCKDVQIGPTRQILQSDLTLDSSGAVPDTYDASIIMYNGSNEGDYVSNRFTGTSEPIIARNVGNANLRGGFTWNADNVITVEAERKRTQIKNTIVTHQLNTNRFKVWSDISTEVGYENNVVMYDNDIVTSTLNIN